MKILLAILIFTFFTANGWTEEIKSPPLTNQVDEACHHGQLQSYKLMPLDTKSPFISPEVWEAYNQVVTEHWKKKDILYPEQGQQRQPLSCHNLTMGTLATMDLDY